MSAALFSLLHTLERWRINPRTWLTEYLHACGTASGRREAGHAPRPPRWSTIVSPDGALLRTAQRAGDALIAPHRRGLQPLGSPLAGGVRTAPLAACQRTTEGHELPLAMLRMHRDGLIPLPAPRRCHSKAPCTAVAPRRRNRSCRSSPASMRCRRCRAPLADQREAQLWREYDRYHYHGYTPLPGARCATWSPASGACCGRRLWRSAGRRLPATASSLERCPTEARLQLVVNNARFLIPWVQVRNLASTVLARSSRRHDLATATDRPAETFVQSDRFAGTSYRAAN